MKIYCGTDIIEVERVKKAILSTPKFKEKIFTSAEISYAENKSDIIKYQHYAGRFAAKEAIYKSISNIYAHVELGHIEITNDSANHNRPKVVIYNTEFNKLAQNIQIDVSISHVKDYAIAYSTASFL
jgi:holo-[acyl-carrier protein] synthase